MKKIKIMLVEKSENLRSVLKNCLIKEGYSIIDFEDGTQAIRNYKDRCCSICLLNTSLPKKDGFKVLRELRAISPHLPVVFISENDSKTERIKSFEAGCNAYISKPFCTEELLLQIETMMNNRNSIKKREPAQTHIYSIGDYIFIYSELKLINDKQTCFLTKKEAQLLRLLYEHKNRLVPREFITKEIWGDSKAADGRSLDVFISKIRNYLFSEKVEIINVYKMGYMLKIKD